MPGDDRGGDAGGQGAVQEAQEHVGVEKILGDGAGGAGVQLALQIVEVRLGAGGGRVDFRVGGDRDLEVGDAAQAGDQVGGVSIAAGVRDVAAAARDVAAQGDDVAHAHVPVAAGDFIDGAARGADAGQVGGRRQAGFGKDAADRGVGARLGGAASAVGDGDEARGELFEPPDAGPKLRFQRLGSGREELKTQGGRRGAGTGRGQAGESRAGQPALQRGWHRIHSCFLGVARTPRKRGLKQAGARQVM